MGESDGVEAPKFRVDTVLVFRMRKLLENRQTLQQHYLAAAKLAENGGPLKDAAPPGNLDHAFVRYGFSGPGVF